VAAVAFWLAFRGGTYDVAAWTTAAIVVWWAVAIGIAVGVMPRRRIPRPAWAAAGLLTAFAALNGLSAVWASGAETPVLAMDRALLYAGVLGLTMVTAGRDTTRRWSDGIAVGVAGISVLALTSRLFPGHFGNDTALQFLPEAHTRLSYPVNYWNGLAILVALAFPLLLRIAVTNESATWRGLALVPIPVVAVTIYLASSRTGAATVVVGAAAFVALSRRRATAAGAAAISIAASIAAIAFVARQHELVNGPLDSSAASAQGWHAALVIAALGFGSALAWAVAGRRVIDVRVPPRAGRVALVAVALVVAAAFVASHPVRRWQDFTRPPSPIAQQNYIANHFLSTNGNWRWQYWMSALDEFKTRPVLGRGAGSYQAWWAERGRLVGFIGNPHSLYFETLGELGLVGLLLIAGAFLVGAATGVRRALERKEPDDEATAAVTAAFLAFAVACGLDWIWELPAVSVVGLALLGLTLMGNSDRRDPAPTRRATWRRPLRVALVALGIAALLAQIDLYSADAKIRDSQQAVVRGDFVAAADAAHTARSLEPWAASPYLQLALVDEIRGQLRPASDWINRAVDRDRGDWRVWLIRARIQAKLGEIHSARTSFARAKQLNPRSQIFLALASSTTP
jgi:hypothetical protein